LTETQEERRDREAQRGAREEPVVERGRPGGLGGGQRLMPGAREIDEEGGADDDPDGHIHDVPAAACQPPPDGAAAGGP
jgi:hypothetical protein